MSDEDTTSEQARSEIFDMLGVPTESEETKEATVTEDVTTKVEETEQPVTEEVQQEETESTEYTEVEKEALELGWKPDGVPGRKKKSAEEWMDDYSLYKKINDLGKQVQEKNSLLDNVAKHFESVQEAAYNQAKKEFDAQVSQLRQLAADTIDEGEYSAEDVISAYENDLKDIKKDHEDNLAKLKAKEETKEEAKEADAPKSKEDVMNTLSPSEQAFVNKHEKVLFSQKADDIAVQAFVVNRNNELAEEGLAADDRITALEKDLAQMFPNKFGSTKKLKAKTVSASKVESASITNQTMKGFSKKNLDREQRELYDFFVEQGVPAEELLSQFEFVIENDK